ncbi:MAG: lysophospholipid acyltransferase family protein [Pseudomonadota bacterium]
MEFTWKERLWLALASWVLAWLVRIWFFTVRVEILDKDIYQSLLKERNDHAIGAFWHRNLSFIVYYFRKLPNRLAMISQSRDGELLARVAQRLGYQLERGSSTRGGTEALRAMIDRMKASNTRTFCGTPADGPQGPARELKKGMRVLAQRTGADLVPVTFSGARVITFAKAWDKTIVPRPFSKVFIGFHPPIKVPRDMSKKELEELRQRLEGVLNDLTEKVDRIAGYTGG